MTDQEILDNAPDGATHVDVSHTYWDLRRCNDHNKVYTQDLSEDLTQDFRWYQTDDAPYVIGLRPLADIQTIVDLRRENAELEQFKKNALLRLKSSTEYIDGQVEQIAELEKERNEISLAQFVYAYFMDQHRNPIDLYHWLIKWNHLKALKESR